MVAGLLVAIPLLRPQSLTVAPQAPHVWLPVLSKPPVVAPPQIRSANPSSVALSVPLTRPAPLINDAPGAITYRRSAPVGDAPLVSTRIGPMTGGQDALNVLARVGASAGAPAPVQLKGAGKLHVSAGVSAGMLLTEIRPTYPPIARAAHVEGTVVLQAVISKTGRIESLHAVSGPEMLRAAAIDAVAAARYRPYLLNHEPVDVETTITVVFRLSS